MGQLFKHAYQKLVIDIKTKIKNNINNSQYIYKINDYIDTNVLESVFKPALTHLLN